MRNETMVLINGTTISFFYFEDGFDTIHHGFTEETVMKCIDKNKDFFTSLYVNGTVSEKLKKFIENNVKDYEFN
mgnify:CR=1 FL=1